jgi:hypothetical protein
MTLQEKAAEKLVDANGNFDPQVLFGDFNSGGKLRITIPQSVGHMPAYYNHRPSASPGYLLDVEPGELEIMVGTSSRDEDLQKVILQVI